MAIETPSLIESVPPGELDGDPAPRRGVRDRVLSMSPGAVRARERRANMKGGVPHAAAGRGTRARKPSRPRTPRTPKSLYPEISAALYMVNTLVGMTPLGSQHEATGTFTPWEITPGVSVPIPDMRLVKLGDELDDMEIAQLAKALDAQCQRSPRFKRYVETVLGAAAGGGIFAIIGLIAARRAARHGIIDRSLDPKLGAMLSGDLGALAAFVPAQGPDETPDPVSGEVAPIPGSDNGNGFGTFDDL